MAAPKSLAQKHEGMKVRKLNGSSVTPVLYNGRGAGHGKYMAGEVAGKLVMDEMGKPLNLQTIGQVVPL